MDNIHLGDKYPTSKQHGYERDGQIEQQKLFGADMNPLLVQNSPPEKTGEGCRQR